MFTAALALVPRPVLAIAAIALGGAAGVQTWRLHDLQTVVAEDRATQAEASRMAERRAREVERQQANTVNRIAQDARNQTGQNDADAADARSAGNGLRMATKEACATDRPAQGSGATDRGKTAGATVAVPADVFEGLIDAAVVLAAAADKAHAAGTACQQSYEAVTSGNDGGPD